MWGSTFHSAKILSSAPDHFGIPRLLRLLARILDDLLRELALFGDEARVRVGSLQRRLDTAIDIDALAKSGLGHNTVGVARDLVDDRPRHAGLSKQAKPGRRIVL